MSQARIFQINVSSGGAPKLPVHAATVTPGGLEGDHQNDRKNHGGPDKALCLYSLERILALQAEGHPTFSPIYIPTIDRATSTSCRSLAITSNNNPSGFSESKSSRSSSGSKEPRITSARSACWILFK